jgi:hypothetical protein
MSQCSASVWKMARRIIAEGNTKKAGAVKAKAAAAATQVSTEVNK